MTGCRPFNYTLKAAYSLYELRLFNGHSLLDTTVARILSKTDRCECGGCSKLRIYKDESHDTCQVIVSVACGEYDGAIKKTSIAIPSTVSEEIVAECDPGIYTPKTITDSDFWM